MQINNIFPLAKVFQEGVRGGSFFQKAPSPQLSLYISRSPYTSGFPVISLGTGMFML